MSPCDRAPHLCIWLTRGQNFFERETRFLGTPTAKGRSLIKQLHALQFPDNLGYARHHEWAPLEGDNVLVGISDHAHRQLGHITFVELPEVGTAIEKGEEFGALNCVKAVSELFMPLGGQIIAVNVKLGTSRGLVNSDPYGGGRLIRVRRTSLEELESLMTADQYIEMLREFE